METLQIIWYILIAVLLIGYSILDGFDLGVGVLLPYLAKDETEKRILLNSIGPFWDGNEVWILTGGGALFAAFPQVYATVFSGFYLALMIVLFSLIFRAVSIEFRAHAESKKFWEWAFIVGSFLPALLYGVALGNVVYGIPIKMINGNPEFSGNFFTLLRPYPLLIGIFGLVMFIIHGATYVLLKSEGDMNERAKGVIFKMWFVWILLFVVSALYTFYTFPHALKRVSVWIFLIITLLFWILYRTYVKNEKFGKAFTMSSLTFIGLWGILASVCFPNIVRAINNPEYSLTIYNASSSKLTLTVMLIIAIIGMPLVILYTSFVYKWFKGKVKLEESVY